MDRFPRSTDSLERTRRRGPPLIPDVFPAVCKGDTVFVPRVFKICSQHLTSDDLKSHLIRSGKQWKEAMKSAGITLVVDGQRIEPERIRIMDLYIKHIFPPGDPNRRALLERLGIPGQVTARHTFMTSRVGRDGKSSFSRT